MPNHGFTGDSEEIIRGLGVILEPGQIVELRALNATTPAYRRPHTVSGYFDAPQKLARLAVGAMEASGIYFTLNPISPALLARASNRLKNADKGGTTSDGDVTARRWLPIDVDPVRPAGISSTDAEHESALTLALTIRDTLMREGWPEPIFADSGNGGHLLWRIDLPTDDGGLVQRILNALAARFDTATMKVDQTTYNPSRIWKLYGTLARKGDNTSDRPHRLARLLTVPEKLEVVGQDLLCDSASPVAREAPPRPPSNGKSYALAAFSIDKFMTSNFPGAEPEPYRGGRRWPLPECPFNPEHVGGSACVFEAADGRLGFRCQHNGCKGKNWHALRDLLDPKPSNTREYNRRREVAESGNHDGENKLGAVVEAWPDPQPLPTGLPPVMPFDFDLLPTSLHGWIKDISDRMQCPPDYCAATAMIVAGSLIGRKVAIRPKRHDDWTVVPNLYGAMVGRPSLLKSPAMKEVLKYLARLEVEAKKEYAHHVAEHEAAALLADATKKVQKEALKQAVKDGGGKAQSIAQRMATESAEPPTRRRYLANDTTVEKLGVILSENANGVLIYVDELASLLKTMDREGHEGDRGFYLTAWAGDSRYTYDRIGRGTLDIDAAIVSILGSIQPGVIADYLRGPVHGGIGDDGLIQRFQMTVWPDVSASWRNVDRYPDREFKSAAHAALQRLAELTPADVKALGDEHDRDAVPFLRFDPAAQAIFDRWRADLETRLRSGVEHPAVESHLAKYRSLIPSLALILHLLDGGVGPIGEASARTAIAWGAYLESHARRLYASVTEAPAVAARLLAARIQAGAVPNLFAARDVYRFGWTGLDRERTESAIDVLVSLQWLEERNELTPGRSRTRFAINPKIQITPKTEPTKPTKAPSVGSVGADFKLNEDLQAVTGDGRERREL